MDRLGLARIVKKMFDRRIEPDKFYTDADLCRRNIIGCSMSETPLIVATC